MPHILRLQCIIYFCLFCAFFLKIDGNNAYFIDLDHHVVLDRQDLVLVAEAEEVAQILETVVRSDVLTQNFSIYNLYI